MTERPLLLVCRHVPRRHGNENERRNWRLLSIASRTHRVHLATLLDGKLSLVEWRGLARRTEKLAIAPRGWMPATRRLVRLVGDAAAAQRFDVVLCDDPALWPLVDSLRATRRLCVHEPAGARRARPLPPDVIRLPHHAAGPRLTHLLAPPPRTHAFPEVVVTQPVLRRAA